MGEYPIEQINAALAEHIERAGRSGDAPPVLHLERDDCHLTIRNSATREVLATYCNMSGCGSTAKCWACIAPRRADTEEVLRKALRKRGLGPLQILPEPSRIHVDVQPNAKGFRVTGLDLSTGALVYARSWLPGDPGTPIYDALEDAFAMTYGWRPGDA